MTAKKKMARPPSALKMKALCQATDVAKSTILLYVKKGLLPAPVKTSPNMAYYDPICIERIAFIKKIQASHRLPLAAIKGLIKEMDKGHDVTPLIELQSALFGGAGRKMNPSTFAKRAGLSEKELNTLCGLELILPIEDKKFDQQDLALARHLKRCMDENIVMADLAYYPDLARKIVSAEIAMREKYTKDLPFKENARLTMALALMARPLRAYVIDRILQRELIKFKGLKKNNPEEK
jgi:DNA-binding transcriptional MerR regulator